MDKNRPGARTRIVFVHGFSGTPQTTWGDLPDLVYDDPDLPSLRVTNWGYKTGIFRKCTGIKDIADLLITRLCESAKSYDQIILVGHSIGGLIVLKALVDEMVERQAAQRAPLDRIERIALFATPLDRDLVQRLIRNLIGSLPGYVARKIFGNRQLRDLHERELIERLRVDVINRIYPPSAGRNKDSQRHIPIHTFVAEADSVVTEAAVRGWFRDPPPRMIEGTDHTTIKMPPRRDDLRYRLLADVFEMVIGPWFRKLVGQALARSRPMRHSAFWKLQQAYMHPLNARLGQVGKEFATWDLGRQLREQRKLLTLVLKQATRYPGDPVGRLLDNAMLEYAQLLPKSGRV